MSRSISGTLNTLLQATHVAAFPLVDLDLAGGMLRICGAPHDVSWNSNTYLSARGLGQIEAIDETDSEIKGLAFTLQGVTTDIISTALADQSQGRSVVVRFAVLNGTALEVDANVWTGRIDTLQIIDGPQPAIRVTAEHRLIAWQTPQVVRFSDADQKRLAAGDRFFEFAAGLTQATIVWPGKEFFQK
jgi:hypothetical protein